MYWNPDPVAFTIPFLNLPIFIYGICFVLGFILGYFLLIRIMTERFRFLEDATIRTLVDQLTWFVVGGTIIGARLGHVFLYDWEHYRAHPWQILNTREGGLASHGGTVGVLLALAIFYFFYYRKVTKHSFLSLLDMMVIPTALVGFFIRLGNFFNQEIIGMPTDVPWAVIFGSPVESDLIVPRHPAQLYEGIAYLMIFFVLISLWYTTKLREREGFFTGLFFLSVFGVRFLVEYVKFPYPSYFNMFGLQAGQTLSIPFILAGFLLLLWSCRKPHRV